MMCLRRITDVDELTAWRVRVIRTVFGLESDDTLTERNRRYYQTHIADGTHIAVVASVDGEDAGCGGLCLTDELPSPENMTGRCGYLMNIFVRESFRGRGVAHRIVDFLVKEAKVAGCGKIYLESTDEARSLYITSGFNDLKNMMIYAETEI